MSGQTLQAFFIGFATAYFAIQACHIMRYPDRTRLHTLLGVIFIYWTVACLKDLPLTMPGQYTDAMLSHVCVIDGWSAITYACFLFELTMPGWVTLRRVLLLCLPFALFTAAYIVLPSEPVLEVYTVFLGIFGLTILFVGYARAVRYIDYIRRNYSNIDRIDISWIRYVYLIAFASQLFWLIISLVRNELLDGIYFISAILMWQLVVAHCRNLRQISPEEEEEQPAPPQAEPQRTYPFAGLMERVVEEEQLFLNPNLSLSDLTQRMGTNRTYMSDYFSNVRRETFYDYINSLRIMRMSVPLMTGHPEYTLDYIARQSGFNSLSTFRRAFRKYTGHNPGSYRCGSGTSAQTDEEA